MKNKNRAFSLIELSIVILIIGILIAGVTQGSRLVNASKIQTAQTLTQSAPVTGLRGLVLWLETTKETSFNANEAADTTALTKWYDSNPQTTNGNTFTSSSASTTYKLNGINGLPSVSFAGTAASTPYFTGSHIITPYSSYTFFIVHRVTSITAANTILYNGTTTATSTGFGISSNASGVTSIDSGATTTFTTRAGTIPAVVGAAQVTTVTIAPNMVVSSGAATAVATPALLGYVNGRADSFTTNTLSANMLIPTGQMYIGNYTGATAATAVNSFIGDISEIIVFDYVVKDSDRKAIEQYLGKKYAIKVSNS